MAKKAPRADRMWTLPVGPDDEDAQDRLVLSLRLNFLRLARNEKKPLPVAQWATASWLHEGQAIGLDFEDQPRPPAPRWSPSETEATFHLRSEAYRERINEESSAAGMRQVDVDPKMLLMHLQWLVWFHVAGLTLDKIAARTDKHGDGGKSLSTISEAIHTVAEWIGLPLRTGTRAKHKP